MSVRIGIFGGSFDPPHVGHLRVVRRARRQLRLDSVVVIPAHDPPHRTRKRLSRAAHRVAMVRLLFRGMRGVTCSTMELRRRGRSYTVDSVRAIARQHPKARLFLIIGQDNYRAFGTWKDPEVIRSLVTVAVYPRGKAGVLLRQRDARDRLLPGPRIPAASVDIRRRLGTRASVAGLLPNVIERYVRSHHLYESP